MARTPEDPLGNRWQVQTAKARFSEFLERSPDEGPQIVTRCGVAVAVLVPVGQWRRLERMARPDLKQLLLAPGTRTDFLTPPRRELAQRPPPHLG